MTARGGCTLCERPGSGPARRKKQLNEHAQDTFSPYDTQRQGRGTQERASQDQLEPARPRSPRKDSLRAIRAAVLRAKLGMVDGELSSPEHSRRQFHAVMYGKAMTTGVFVPGALFLFVLAASARTSAGKRTRSVPYKNRRKGGLHEKRPTFVRRSSGSSSSDRGDGRKRGRQAGRQADLPQKKTSHRKSTYLPASQRNTFPGRG